MSSAYGDPYDVIPVVEAEESARIAYMRQLGIYTFGSLVITGIAAVLMMGALDSIPALRGRIPSLVIMLGGIYGAQFVGNSLTLSPNAGTRWMGYLVAPALAGAALSYLLYIAVAVGAQSGNPLEIIGQAGALTGLTVFGMVAYLLSGPRQLNFLAAGLSMLFLPMLGLMALTVVFPVGGVFGMIISAVFVVVSAAGLLYTLNQVLHEYSTDMVLPGATRVAIGIVVVFWNILSLILSSRD
ncbi:MAG: Bax inhibitor-1 family protein [Myxococcota bacterium]